MEFGQEVKMQGGFKVSPQSPILGIAGAGEGEEAQSPEEKVVLEMITQSRPQSSSSLGPRV